MLGPLQRRLHSPPGADRRKDLAKYTPVDAPVTNLAAPIPVKRDPRPPSASRVTRNQDYLDLDTDITCDCVLRVALRECGYADVGGSTCAPRRLTFSDERHQMSNLRPTGFYPLTSKRRDEVIELAGTLGRFDVILVDFPWQFGTYSKKGHEPRRRASL
jgi:hypothetical protein